MKNELLKKAQRAVKHWWVSLLIGILGIIVGVWCLATPDSTLVALTMLFVVAFLIGGTLEIIFAVSNRNHVVGWGWSLAGGILDLLLGVLLLSMPLHLITIILVYFVGFSILIRSIWGIGVAADINRLGVKGWGWLLTLAIVGVIFSFLFFISPAFGGGFLVAFAGFSFMIYGVFRMYLAFVLRSFKDHAEDAKEFINQIERDL